MPTLRTPRRNISVSVTGGRSQILQDRRGTTVRYTGTLTIDGRRVLSPHQTREAWATAGTRAMDDADRTEHTDLAAHWQARGLCGAYAGAIQVLDGWFDGPLAGKPLTDVVAALRMMRAQVFEQAPSDINDLQQSCIAASGARLAALADELATTATYTWEDDQ